MPDANIALFAHDEWTKDDPRCDGLFMVHDCPAHKRAKLWALNQTPFDKTVYLDADTYVCDEDITDMFEFDTNMMFTNIRPYAGKISKFIGGEMTLHGGVFGYDSSDITIQFMKDWFDYYDQQNKQHWWPDDDIQPREDLRHWDQFTLWWLIEYEYKGRISHGIYKDDARYNFVHVYKPDECEGEIVVWHYTIPQDALPDERNIDPQSRNLR